MRRLLVTGASGDLGRAVSARAVATWVTYGAYFRNPHIGGGQAIQVDLRSREAVLSLFRNTQPDTVIHCAASDRSPDMETTNRAAAAHVSNAARMCGARLIALSTDMVFDGRNPPYREDSPPTPLSAYGQVKADNERRMLEAHDECLIVRTSLIYDFAATNRQASWMISRIAEGQPIQLFVDEIRQPVWVWNLADALLELAHNSLRGILQVAGPEPLSRYDYGCALLRALGLATADVVEPTEAAKLVPDRPRDLTMDLSKAKAVLSTQLLSLEQALESSRKTTAT